MTRTTPHDQRPLPPTWEEVPDHLRALVDRSFARGGDGGLWFACAAGDELLLTATSRTFAKGRHHDPVIELAALALGLGADRLAVAVTARAWSPDDPVVPVTQGVDLRQRVCSIALADGHGRADVARRDLLVPFEVVDGRLLWSDALEDGQAQGWLPEALATIVAARARVRGGDRELLQQLRSCTARGHVVDLTPAGAAVLAPLLEAAQPW